MAKDNDLTSQSTSSSNRFSTTTTTNSNRSSFSSYSTTTANPSSITGNRSSNNTNKDVLLLPLHQPGILERNRTPDLEAFGNSGDRDRSRKNRTRTPSPTSSINSNSTTFTNNSTTNADSYLHHHHPHHPQQQQQQQHQHQQRPLPFSKRRPSLTFSASASSCSSSPSSSPTSIRHGSSTRRRPRWMLIGVLAIGLLLPIWVLSSGVITLDSFNDVVRYLPGYHHFANNLLYLVMFLLWVSFTALAVFPSLPMLLLGLPFHLLIFSIFRKLMSDWVWWCIGCYTTLILAPLGSTLLMRCKVLLLGGVAHGVGSRVHSSSASSMAYFGKGGDLHGVSTCFRNRTVQDRIEISLRKAGQRVGKRIEWGVHLFSKTNRTSTRWRLLLALGLFLSYVVPVTMRNEARDFDPARSAPLFDIRHPEPLCSSFSSAPLSSSSSASSSGSLSGHGARNDAVAMKEADDAFDGYWQEYLRFHRKMVLPEKEGGVADVDKRFLVFQPSDDGLGNRLQALLSAVVMAMVTQRAIILDWVAMPQCNANFTDLFMPPEGLSWDLNTTLPAGYKETPSYKQKPEIWFPYCRNCALRSPITPNSTWSKLMCDRDLGLDSSTPLVQILSTQWFLPVIQHNPHWRSELCRMFPRGGQDAFRTIATRLLKPAKAVQDKIDSVLERIPEGVTLVGLQVRRTENNAVGQGIEDAFLKCAAEVVEEEQAAQESLRVGGELRGQDGLKRWRYVDEEDEENQVKQVDSLGALSMVQQGRAMDSESSSSSSFSTPKRFAYYLATDYRPTRAHFQKVLGDQLFVLENTFDQTKVAAAATSAESHTSGAGSGPDNIKHDLLVDGDSSHVTPSVAASLTLSSSGSSATIPISQTEAVVRNNVQGVQTAVAEMYLLAHSHRIVSSPYSTFGYFAHALANIQPNIVKRDGTCTHRKSTQPCFQYWFGFANGGSACSVKATIEMSEDYDCWL